MVAVAVIGAGVVGAGATMYASGKASDAQSKAAAAAAAQQQAQYEQTRKDLAPFVGAGTDATNQLTAALPSLTAPMQMTQAQLEATPGYQFNLSQGLKATQNSAAARGLGLSGAAMKGAAAYATGLADSTYTNQFNMDQTNKTNAYNKLLGVSQLGSNAAAQVGSYGQQTANQISNNLTGAANAQAGAYMASGNAIGSAANSLGNYYMQNQLMQGMYGQNAGYAYNGIGGGMGGVYGGLA